LTKKKKKTHADGCRCVLMCSAQVCTQNMSDGEIKSATKLANSECLHNKIELFASFTYGKKKS